MADDERAKASGRSWHPAYKVLCIEPRVFTAQIYAFERVFEEICSRFEYGLPGSIDADAGETYSEVELEEALDELERRVGDLLALVNFARVTFPRDRFGE